MQADQSSAQSSDKPTPIDGARLVSLINALRKLPWPMTYEVYDSLIQELGWQLVKPREQEPQTGHEQCMHYDGYMPLLATIENDVVTSVASSPVIDVIHQLPADACRTLYDEYCAAGTAAWGWPTDVRHTGHLTGTVWKGFAPQTPASREYVSINLNEEDKTIMFVLASEQTGAPSDGAAARARFVPILALIHCRAWRVSYMRRHTSLQSNSPPGLIASCTSHGLCLCSSLIPQCRARVGSS